MFRTRLATTVIAAAVAITPAVAVAAPSAPAAPVKPLYYSPNYGICAASAVITKQPGRGILGNLVKGDTIKVKRLSHSGLYVYGFARGTANKNGWIKVAAVCPRSGAIGDPRVANPYPGR